MWEFVVHKYGTESRWIWMQVGVTGRGIRRSGQAFPTWSAAFSNALAHGFDWTSDRYSLIEVSPSKIQVDPQPAASSAAA